jgi:hypothetical protein
MSDQAMYISPEELEAMRKKDAERIVEYKRAIALMKVLDIPCNKYSLPSYHIPPTIYATDLYDILMDEEKLQALISKLKLKAFW